MTSLEYGERGEIAALRSNPAMNSSSSNNLHNTSSHRSPHHLISQNALRPKQFAQNPSRPSRESTSTFSFAQNDSQDEQLPQQFESDHLDLPTPEHIPSTSLLRDTVFPDWKDASTVDALESPEEMQKKDPLGTQIWKLYSRTKTRLPNQERMENLTWRMMAMNLRRREQNRELYVSPLLNFLNEPASNLLLKRNPENFAATASSHEWSDSAASDVSRQVSRSDSGFDELG